MGSLLSAVALPWFVLQTTGSPSRMGLVLAAESAPLLARRILSVEKRVFGSEPGSAVVRGLGAWVPDVMQEFRGPGKRRETRSAYLAAGGVGPPRTR
jgi:hypothetical protein